MLHLTSVMTFTLHFDRLSVTYPLGSHWKYSQAGLVLHLTTAMTFNLRLDRLSGTGYLGNSDKPSQAELVEAFLLSMLYIESSMDIFSAVLFCC